MIHLILALTVALLCDFAEAEITPIQCDAGGFRCADNSRCVQAVDLCDYNKDCDDFSDEEFSMCRKFLEKKGPCAVGNWDLPIYGCEDINSICSKSLDQEYEYPNHEHFLPLCTKLVNGLKPQEEFVAMKQEISALRDNISALTNRSSVQDLFELLATSFNESSIRSNDSDCPPLYSSMGGKCMSFFTLATLTWAEAEHFCESISGKLAIYENFTDYETLLEHLKSKGLTGDFWIGGLYTYSKSQNSSGWKWLDGKDIILRAPYWSQYNAQNCFSLGNVRKCYPLSLAPKENKDGICLALDYGYQYYFIDKNCDEKRSPLCVLNNI